MVKKHELCAAGVQGARAPVSAEGAWPCPSIVSFLGLLFCIPGGSQGEPGVRRYGNRIAASSMSNPLVNAAQVIAVYAGLIAGGVIMFTRLRARGWGHPASLVAMFAAHCLASAGIAVLNTQEKMQSGQIWNKEWIDYKIQSPLDPLPPRQEPRVLRERWWGPLLVERVSEERGIRELGGGSRTTTLRWPVWDVPGTGIVMGGVAAGASVGVLSWRGRRRRARETLASPTR